MEESRNQYQIIRKDNKNCFVESLSDAFEIGKAHLAFLKVLADADVKEVALLDATQQLWCCMVYLCGNTVKYRIPQKYHPESITRQQKEGVVASRSLLFLLLFGFLLQKDFRHAINHHSVISGRTARLCFWNRFPDSFPLGICRLITLCRHLIGPAVFRYFSILSGMVQLLYRMRVF